MPTEDVRSVRKAQAGRLAQHATYAACCSGLPLVLATSHAACCSGLPLARATPRAAVL